MNNSYFNVIEIILPVTKTNVSILLVVPIFYSMRCLETLNQLIHLNVLFFVVKFAFPVVMCSLFKVERRAFLLMLKSEKY